MEAVPRDAGQELARARNLYEQRAWAKARKAFLRADEKSLLAADDLDRLALASYLVGRDDDYLAALGRAFQAHLDAGQVPRAVRCAFWLGFRLLMRNETGRATGWLSRAGRLLERECRECAESGL